MFKFKAIINNYSNNNTLCIFLFNAFHKLNESIESHITHHGLLNTIDPQTSFK